MTPNQISTNLPFNQNLVLNYLDEPDKTSLVYDLSNGYNSLDMLLALKGIESRRIDGDNGKFEKPIMGRNTITATLAANATASGANLVLTFTDAQFQNFRLNDLVYDSSIAMTQGMVIAASPGTITIQPVTTALTAGTHFLSGATVVQGWNVSENRNSTNPAAQYEYPDYVWNCTAVTRDYMSLNRRDMSKTWVRWNGNYWWSSQDVLMLQRYYKKQAVKDFMSQRALNVAGPNGTFNQNGGLFWAIKDPERGGIDMPLASAMTEADLIRFAVSLGKQRAMRGDIRIPAYVGLEALAAIQQFATLSNAVQFSGQSNTFGGAEVKGLDIRTYKIAGIEFDFLIDPLLNDRNTFPGLTTLGQGTWMQNTIWALDFSDYSTSDGKIVPAIERVYFGDRELNYNITPGVAMTGGPNVGFGGESAPIAVSSADSIGYHLYSDCGIDAIATKMGVLYYAA